MMHTPAEFRVLDFRIERSTATRYLMSRHKKPVSGLKAEAIECVWSADELLNSNSDDKVERRAILEKHIKALNGGDASSLAINGLQALKNGMRE
jgi:hypothetical protein